MIGTRTRTVIRAVPRPGADRGRAGAMVSGLLPDLLDEPEVAGPLRTVRPAFAGVGTPGNGAAAARQQLVVALARMHGVLDLDLGTDGELLHLLAGTRTRGADGEVEAAHRRVTGRITEMWRAGAPEDEECHR